MGRALTIEIRSLNSKQGDINVRMPSVYREKEIEMRELIASKLERGKIDLSIQRDLAEGEASNELNEALVASYYKLFKKLEENLDEAPGSSSVDYLSLILKMPDVLKPSAELLEEDEYQILYASLIECIEKVQAFRKQEGLKLEAVLKQGVENIHAMLRAVEPLEQERLDRIKSRITGNLGEDGGDMPEFDRDRFEQELIYYLEKLDITEEKVRLNAHCEYFLTTLMDEEIKGKKLSFIAQEMGREINTLGSKAQHSAIQRLVVGMKDELEKIKEQVLNVL